jgi:2-methylisocitrate lyase-like PEP mutase family enzyme
MNQVKKAQDFKALHVKGQPVVLYNIWDAGGAKALVDAGATAVATGSWSVAAAQGYKDGEAIPLDFVLQIVSRIAGTVDVPLSVDFEGAYSSAPETVTQNVRKIIQAGAIGINFEDQRVGGEGLYAIEEQVARIKAARQAAELEAIPLFINARTDLFLKAGASSDHAGLLDEALTRGAAYAEAGADGFFVPALTDHALIKRVCDTSSIPVNVMMRGALTSLEVVADLGVSRASYGPGPYASAMSDLAERYRNL